MSKSLKGSAGDGKKIMDSFNEFSYKFKGEKIEPGRTLNTYTFEVGFRGDEGTFTIEADSQGNITDNSLIVWDNMPNSLSIAEDSSLKRVAIKLIKNI